MNSGIGSSHCTGQAGSKNGCMGWWMDVSPTVACWLNEGLPFRLFDSLQCSNLAGLSVSVQYLPLTSRRRYCVFPLFVFKQKHHLCLANESSCHGFLQRNTFINQFWSQALGYACACMLWLAGPVVPVCWSFPAANCLSSCPPPYHDCHAGCSFLLPNILLNLAGK